MTRPIKEIARDITRAWGNINYAAEPYLDAMFTLNTIEENYYFDTARSVVLYFLANANTFRGEDARNLKAELREILA